MDPAISSLIDRAGLDKAKVRQLIGRGLDGADDGELFLEYRQAEVLVFDNGRLKQATYDTAQGFGLRAVKDEAVGYAHASDVSEAALARAAEAVRAVKGGHSGHYADAPGRTNRKLYGDCASKPEYYFGTNDPTKLKAIFGSIASIIAKLQFTG